MLSSFSSSRIARFAAVGVGVMLFFMGLNALLAHAFGLAPRIAFLVAYPPALLAHFTLNKLWTFRDGRATSGRHIAEYIYSSVLTFLVQWPCFLVLQGIFKAPGWLAAGGASFVQMSVSYLLLKWRVFGKEAQDVETGSAGSWSRLVVLLVTLGGAAILAWTTLGEWKMPAYGGSQPDYYNRLVSGFRKGSLALDIEVPEALKKLEDPWNSANRMQIPVPHDVSYFNGHYYLYFGVVPAVLVFWPFRIVMGYDLPNSLAMLGHLTLAYLIACWLWQRILRDWFPRAGLVTRISGPLILGLSAGQLVLARRPSIWEMPIAAGHFYVMAMLAASYLALTSTRPWRWLGVAGLALGLAVGCRPTLAAAGAGLACLAIAVGFDGAGGPGIPARLVRTIKAALWIGIPLTAVMSGLLAYNWARFGNPLEFGLRYQLSGGNEAKAHHFLLSFVPFNIGEYFLHPPQWGRYFPFIHPTALGATPKGYYGVEYVYGVLVVCPAIWWVLFGPGLLGRSAAPAIRRFAGCVLAMALAMTAFLLCFNTAAARYVVDFLPWWLWLALLGWAWLEGRLSGGEGAARLPAAVLGVLFGATAAFSFALAALQSLVLHGILIFSYPEAYHAIARVLDQPAALWERFRGEPLGKIVMKVRFPEKNSGSLEPLVVSGVEYETDYYFVFYKTSRLIQLGFENAGDLMMLSDDIQVDPSHVYSISFGGGSLYPPADHPAFSGWKQGEVFALSRWIQVAIDGKTVVNQERLVHELVPEQLQIGRDVRSGAFGRIFSGTVLSVEREPLRRPVADSMPGGDVVINVELSGGVVPGPQPLLTVGRPGLAELVGLRRLDAGHFTIAFEEWGAGMWESPPIEVPENHKATFRIRLGPILELGKDYPYPSFNRELVVWMNDLPIWWRPSVDPIGQNPPLDILANTVGSSAMRSSFDGNLMSWGREEPPTWRASGFSGIEMDLAGRSDRTEPLLATGTAGAADTLAIEWLSGGRARLQYDHWGSPVHSSPDFPWDERHMHQLKIYLPSIKALDKEVGPERTGRIHVVVDGLQIWDVDAPYFPAKSSTLSVGQNRSGSSISADTLRAFIGDLRQLP